MSDNAFDMVRKIRHLPGLQLTATVNPTHISKRVKTAAQKMLRTGSLSAGYRSKSRLLAEQLLKDAGREAPVSATKWGVCINDVAILTPEAREQLVELIGAAKLLEHANDSRNNADYINERYGRMASEAKRTKFGRLSMHMYHLVIAQQIAEVVSTCRTPLMVEIHNELADKLDSTEPFAINF
jgi:hypothetical protein